MGIAPQTKNRRFEFNSVHSVPSADAAVLVEESAGSQTRSVDLDQFKFKLVERGAKHYFQDVRFKAPHISSTDEKSIIEFFEGQCLEGLSSEIMSGFFGNLPIGPKLEKLVVDLQQVLCD